MSGHDNTPRGSCLVCGHDKPFRVWHYTTLAGVCNDCYAAAKTAGARSELEARLKHDTS